MSLASLSDLRVLGLATMSNSHNMGMATTPDSRHPGLATRPTPRLVWQPYENDKNTLTCSFVVVEAKG